MEDFDQMRLALQTIGEFFTSSLGPKGLDKLIYDAFDNHLIVSNDGATILKSMEDLIAPKLSNFLLKWGKVIAEQVGDGIKSFYILLGAFLGECQNLFSKKILNANIIDTIHFIQQQWNELKLSLSFICPPENITQNFLQQYLKMGLMGRFSAANVDHITQVVSHLLISIPSDKLHSKSELKSSLHFQYLPGALIKDSKVFQGAIISKEPANFSIYPPTGYYNAKILLITAKLYYDLPKKGDEQNSIPYELVYSDVQKITQTQDFLKEFANKWGERIKSLGCDMIITEKGVEDALEQYFTLNRILLIRRAKAEEIKWLSDYFHIQTVDQFEDLSQEKIGIIPRITYEKIGKDSFFLFDSFSKHCEDNTQNDNQYQLYHTILIGGPTYYICQELERYFTKLILQGQKLRFHQRYFIGGGNLEMQMGIELQKKADTLADIRGWILKEISSSFFKIPRVLAQSSGQDALNLLVEYRSKLCKDTNVCLDVNSGQFIHNPSVNFFESYSEKVFLFDLLFESLIQILRIEKVISKRRKVQ